MIETRRQNTNHPSSSCTLGALLNAVKGAVTSYFRGLFPKFENPNKRRDANVIIQIDESQFRL